MNTQEIKNRITAIEATDAAHYAATGDDVHSEDELATLRWQLAVAMDEEREATEEADGTATVRRENAADFARRYGK